MISNVHQICFSLMANQVLIFSLYIFFSEMSIHVFAHFLTGLFFVITELCVFFMCSEY